MSAPFCTDGRPARGTPPRGGSPLHGTRPGPVSPLSLCRSERRRTAPSARGRTRLPGTRSRDRSGGTPRASPGPPSLRRSTSGPSVAGVSLDEPWVLDRLETDPPADDVRGLARANQRAAPQRVEAVRRCELGELGGLAASGLVQRTGKESLKAPPDV